MNYKYLLILTFAFFLATSSYLSAQCPVANACTPGAAPVPNQIFGMGIYNVVVGGSPGISKATNGVTDGYKNYSCTDVATLTEGVAWPVTITTNPNVPENVRIWLDLNNNGAFDATTELVFSSNNNFNHTGTITIPVSATIPKFTRLRLRISADNFSSPIPTPCSTPAYSQVEDYSVIVNTNASPPLVNFSANKTITCDGTVQFQQLVQNGATSYKWYFGDNTTSTAANPAHTYLTPGTYPVKLVACNPAGCDSVLKTNYITYHTNVPIPASCTPATIAYCCGYGITSVTFGALTNTSANASVGYEDFTCTKSLTVQEGLSYPISLVTNPGNQQDTKVYIDYNNDGIFTAAELVFTKLNTIDPNGNITIKGGAILNTPLRLRIISDEIGSTFTTCGGIQSGQAEDYTIIITPNTNIPTTNFTSNATTSCDTLIQFTDTSINAPSSFSWDFGDNTTSTLQNPLHNYTAAGIYTVKLRTCNANGCDSLTKVNYIVVTKPCVQYCPTASVNNNNNLWITRVQFGTIDNISANDPLGYGNYSGKNTTVIKGNPYNLSVTASNNFNRRTSAWIDYNHNNQFDSNEMVANGLSSGTYNQSITISTGALSGPARMRVITRGGPNTISPCLVNQLQTEIEDYTVVIEPNNQPPVALFTASNTTSCTLTIAFTDTSRNTPTTWLWNFGDPASGANNTSTLQNPTHVFSGPGVYTVSLTVTNSFGNAPILVKNNYITISGNSGPLAISCKPATTAATAGLGIYKVTLNTINNTSGSGVDGYKDYSCSQQTTLTLGNSYPITILNGPTTNENVRVWIDYDNSGSFDAVNELVFSSDNKRTHTGTISPKATAVTNQALRMRVSSDWSQNPAPTPCSPVQYSQVEDYTVTIQPINQQPVIAFSAAGSACSKIVAFTDSSSNLPTNWLWNFGDPASGAANTSTLQNPSHTFSGPGTYTITLMACNAIGCPTSPLIKTNYVVITGNTGPVAVSCTPGTTSPTGGLGIINVTLNTINNTTGNGVDGYKDYSCTKQTTLTLGIPTAISVKNGPNTNENVRVWIDYDNNGVFDAVNELAFSSNNKLLHTGTITPAATAVLNQPLRMRVSSDWAQNAAPGPCTQVQYSQVEDYTVTIIPNTALPVATFTQNSTTTCGAPITFTDQSTNGPTGWAWNFGDPASGASNTSTLQNPSHTFSGPGTYTVTLVASNGNGSNNATVQITVTAAINLVTACAPVTTAYCCGIGIKNVTFLSITNATPDGSDGYKDYSCTKNTTAAFGTYTLTVQTGTISNENVQAWIDFNNDGLFALSERVMMSMNAKSHTAQVTIPTTAVVNTYLRMRIKSDYTSVTVSGACVSPQYGQVEDYAIKILSTGIAETAFEKNITVAPNPTSGKFTVQLPADNKSEFTVSAENMIGQTIMQTKLNSAGNNRQNLDLSKFPKGIYLIRIYNQEVSAVKKIVIE